MRSAARFLVVVAAAGCGATPTHPMPPEVGPDLAVAWDFTVPADGSPDMASAGDQAASGDLAVAGDAAIAMDQAMEVDQAMPIDQAMATDLVSLPDLAGVPDLVMVPDLAIHPDLVMAVADLAAPRDLAMPADIAAVKDLAALPDLACPMACNTPPAAKCEANVIRTYMNPGSCAQGACSYPSMTMNCMYGCYQAQCTAVLSFLGNTAAFQSGTPNQVTLNAGSAPSNNSVSAITQTFPHGAAKSVHLIYSLNDKNFGNPVDLTMLADPNAPPGNNDQWYAIIPAQAKGTHVYWYLRADKYDGGSLYDPMGFGNHFDYTTN